MDQQSRKESRNIQRLKYLIDFEQRCKDINEKSIVFSTSGHFIMKRDQFSGRYNIKINASNNSFKIHEAKTHKTTERSRQIQSYN